MDTALLAEGKTKQVVDVGDGYVRLLNKEDITAGDGARRDSIKGKGEISTRTTVNVFKLLRACGIPVAYKEQDAPNSFIAPRLNMIPLEVVVRGKAYGSDLERNPKAGKLDLIEPPRVEFFLKTSGRAWGKYDLACDDPFMVIRSKDVFLHHAHQPFIPGTYFLRLSPAEAFPVAGTQAHLKEMEYIAFAVFLILRHAWASVGTARDLDIDLIDMKVEFGFDKGGRLLLGDVIDGESCRILVDGEHSDKQGFREGDSLEKTKLALGRTAVLSEDFKVLERVLVHWARDNVTFA